MPLSHIPYQPRRRVSSLDGWACFDALLSRIAVALVFAVFAVRVLCEVLG